MLSTARIDTQMLQARRTLRVVSAWALFGDERVSRSINAVPNL